MNTQLELVPIYVMGKRHLVPDSLTILKAIEYAGYSHVRGCGCRGGVCGACVSVWRVPDDYKLEVGLACQTRVRAGMNVVQIPFFPTNKAKYKLADLEPTAKQIRELYPEIARCMGCNTCTKVCPQKLDVMKYVSAALRGDLARTAALSLECLMCGLCAARCPAQLSPYLIGVLSRRLYGRFIQPKNPYLPVRLKAIREGEYNAEIDKLMTMNKEEIKGIYVKVQKEKKVA